MDYAKEEEQDDKTSMTDHTQKHLHRSNSEEESSFHLQHHSRSTNSDDATTDKPDGGSAEQHNVRKEVKAPANAPRYEARCAFKGGDAGETDLEDEEIVSVLEKTGTGWWMVVSSTGRGWVPSHFLRLPSSSSKSVCTIADLPDDVYEDTAPRKYMPKIPNNKESVKLKGHIAFRYLQFAHGNIDIDSAVAKESDKQKSPLQLDELFKGSPYDNNGNSSSTTTTSSSFSSISGSTNTASKPTATVHPVRFASQPTTIPAEKLTDHTTQSHNTATSRPGNQATRPDAAVKSTVHEAKPRIPKKTRGPPAKSEYPINVKHPGTQALSLSSSSTRSACNPEPQLSTRSANKLSKPPPTLPKKHQHHHPGSLEGVGEETQGPDTLQSVSDLRAMFNKI